MKISYFLPACFSVLVSLHASAQNAKVKVDSPEYENLKKSGKLKVSSVETPKGNAIVFSPNLQRNGNPGQNQTHAQHALCNCLIPLDSTFQVVPFTNGTPPEYRNDDGSSPLITLPFNFCFYGTNYTDVYINNNGNISFNNPYFTYSPVGFPSNQYFMVAPFWGDVDTRTNFQTGTTLSGLVYYKITPTSLIVKWDTVGYFATHDDLLNTFQLIITDGTDPILPPGNNVNFCYGDMNWTTGDASQGVGGYGGFPANVGANSGNGIDFIQFGRFD